MTRPRNPVAHFVGRWIIGPLLALAVIAGLVYVIAWAVLGIIAL